MCVLGEEKECWVVCNEQLKFQVWNGRGHWSAESRSSLMGSKERKQPHRLYLLFLSETAVSEQTHQNADRFICVVPIFVFWFGFKSQNTKSWTKECMFFLGAKAGGSCKVYLCSCTEKWWKNILGGGERERRWVSRFCNSANVKIIAACLLHTEGTHKESFKSLCLWEYAVLQFGSHGSC